MDHSPAESPLSECLSYLKKGEGYLKNLEKNLEKNLKGKMVKVVVIECHYLSKGKMKGKMKETLKKMVKDIRLAFLNNACGKRLMDVERKKRKF